MRIVLDTNVLVSGLLKARSIAGAIIRLIAAGKLQVVYDARILLEYRDVLYRSKFGFAKVDIEAILSQIKAEGILAAVQPLPFELPDRDDEPFLEAACAVTGALLITGNKKHFPIPADRSMTIYSPTEFIEWLRKQES